VQANPPESVNTDISLSQFLAIQEKGVSAWEFEPELEVANCFVEGRTEVEFFDSICSVQSNLPIPKQNEVYYFEAKIYEKPDNTTIGIGLTTKPYPLFRLPGKSPSSMPFSPYLLFQVSINILSHIAPMVLDDIINLSVAHNMLQNFSKVMLLVLDIDLDQALYSLLATERNWTMLLMA
jgi:hypothetical protein